MGRKTAREKQRIRKALRGNNTFTWPDTVGDIFSGGKRGNKKYANKISEM